jgi:magnesium-transporting ATPase (P-type)
LAYGGLPAQYDPEAYAEAVNVAQSVYFFTLVGMQWGNLLATRTRRLSIFQTNPFGPNSANRNLWIPPAMMASIAFLFFFSYVPFFQNTFLTRVCAARVALAPKVGSLTGTGGTGRTHIHPFLLRARYPVSRRDAQVLCAQVSQGFPRKNRLVVQHSMFHPFPSS